MLSSSFYISLFFFLFTLIYPILITSSSQTPSYTDHCSFIVPESTPTTYTYSNPFLNFETSYITGGNKLLSSHLRIVGKYLRFRAGQSIYETKAKGIYKIDAFLYFQLSYTNFSEARSNYTLGGSYPHVSRSDDFGNIKFLLNGFWSEYSRKLCMVGSSPRQASDVVLKLRFASENANIYNSVITGSLESISSTKDEKYFDPFLIFRFPEVTNYKYSLVPKDLGGGFSGVSKKGFISFESPNFCRFLFAGRSTFLKTENVVDGLLPRFLSLTSIQCSENEKKLRYIIKFLNFIPYGYNIEFSLNSTFIGEASWDDKNNQLDIVACRLFNPIYHFEDAVGDCIFRISLRYTSILTIRDEASIVGQIWTTKINDGFDKMNLTSYERSNIMDSPGLTYEYTELDKVKKYCPTVKKSAKKEETYPAGDSYDMRFDMTVKNSKGEKFAWGFVIPLFVGNESFERNYAVMEAIPLPVESESFEMNYNMVEATSSGPVSEAVYSFVVSEPERRSAVPVLNMSYRLSINPFPQTKFGNWFSTLNLSRNHHGEIEVTAEGVYSRETGHLCMVGCRKLQNSTDCEILVNFKFYPSNGNGRDSLTKGTIRSTRSKRDPLYFEDLSLSSAAFTTYAAKQSILRMDWEIAMVLASNTLSCIFIVIQLFHVKKNPETLSCISLVMLVILSLGHMVPLVLNFESLFSGRRISQEVILSTGRWVEASKVTIRVVTMVAFLLQFRLVQLVWTTNTSNGNETGSWIGEKKTSFVSLPLYILGGLVALVKNWTTKYSLWASIRSYAGLVLDGFLFPQIVLNVFQGSTEKALSHPFYIGTSAIRLLPHAYDQYRAQNYPTSHVNGTYFYADHAADFYSTAWDVVIPIGVMALALIVFLQQRYGGRWIVPQRFRELELYEKVPSVVINE